MPKLELKETKSGLEVFANGAMVGTVHRVGPNDYAYTSTFALLPYKHGRCNTEVGALAHLGYRRVRKAGK